MDQNCAENKWVFETAPEPVSEELIQDGGNADVIVVGAGTSGTFAAVAAAAAGASVIVLQKGDSPHTFGSGSGVFGSRVQCEAGIWFDPDEWVRGMYKEASGYAQQRYLETVIFNSGKAIDMAEDIVKRYRGKNAGHFAVNNRGIYSGPGVSWENAETLEKNGIARDYVVNPSLIRLMTDIAIKDMEVKYHFNTPGFYLEQNEEGMITGIIAKHSGCDGRYLRFKAKRGVILATGDIIGDPDMVSRYCPFSSGMIEKCFASENTGDGHKMILWAGGKMHKGPFNQAIHFDPTCLPEGDAPGSGQPWLAVNALGRRYQNEDSKYFMIANECIMQPGSIRWQIFDSHNYENWNKFSTSMMRGMLSAKLSGLTWEEAMADAINRGAVLVADTLEELAGKMGFSGQIKQTFLDECARYQSFVESGYDPDFHKDPEVLKYTMIKDAPFYAIKRRPQPIHFADGAFVNEQMQIVDEYYRPIGGGKLYAAGNVTHGMFGFDYPQNPGGMTSGRCFATGFIAGTAAAGGRIYSREDFPTAPEGAQLQKFRPYTTLF